MIQEDIERRSVAITVKAGKLTARVLARAVSAAYLKMRQKQAQPPRGKQSAKQLLGHTNSSKTIPLDGNTRLWDRVARKYGVDYAFYKTGPKKHLLLFKAGQADAITAAFNDYTKCVMARAQEKRPSILRQLKQYAEQARSKPRQREKTREAVHNDR